MKVKKFALVLVCLAIIMSVTACSSNGVDKEVYDAVVSERDELTQRVQQLEGALSEKEKEIESLKSSSDVADVDYVESITNNMSSDLVSYEVRQEQKTVVVIFVFGMDMEDFVLVRDLIKEEHESLVKDFSGLVKNIADSFVGWTVVGILQTTDNLPIEVVINGDVVKY